MTCFNKSFVLTRWLRFNLHQSYFYSPPHTNGRLKVAMLKTREGTHETEQRRHALVTCAIGQLDVSMLLLCYAALITPFV